MPMQACVGPGATRRDYRDSHARTWGRAIVHRRLTDMILCLYPEYGVRGHFICAAASRRAVLPLAEGLGPRVGFIFVAYCRAAGTEATLVSRATGRAPAGTPYWWHESPTSSRPWESRKLTEARGRPVCMYGGNGRRIREAGQGARRRGLGMRCVAADAYEL